MTITPSLVYVVPRLHIFRREGRQTSCHTNAAAERVGACRRELRPGRISEAGTYEDVGGQAIAVCARLGRAVELADVEEGVAGHSVRARGVGGRGVEAARRIVGGGRGGAVAEGVVGGEVEGEALGVAGWWRLGRGSPYAVCGRAMEVSGRELVKDAVKLKVGWVMVWTIVVIVVVECAWIGRE